MKAILANHLSNQREILLKNWFNRIRTEDTLHYQNKTDEELLPALGQIYDEIVTYLNSGDNSKINSHIQHLVGRRTQEMYVLDELLMLFSTIRQTCFEEGLKLFADSSSQLFECFNTLTDLFEKCRVKAANTYVEMQKQIIDSQHRALELSTPVLPIDDQIIIVPLIGTVDSRRANQFTEAVLKSIIDYQVDIVIIDITGVPVVDTQVANHLIKTVQAANLLGAQCILVGVRPEIAQTIIRLGIEFNQFLTAGNLKKGFALAKSLVESPR
ncbi:MAG: STAS domain-containing protein [Bacillota bacterium]|jgi:anti-anti-sigma regulatory factor